MGILPISNTLEPWRALRVRPRHDRTTAAHLASRGVEHFVPVYRSRSRWSDRTKQLELPLFPGYVFCRFPASQKLEVITAPGVISVVGFGRTPGEISDEEMSAIRRIETSGLPYGPCPYLRIGETVTIESGCLEGMKGVVVRERDSCRIVVNVELLQRSVAVEIDRVSVRREGRLVMAAAG